MPIDSPPASPSRVSRRGLVISAIAAAIVMALVVGNGIMSRNAVNARLKETMEAQAVPPVSVITPGAGGNKSWLDLPGRLEAYARAPIYARVSGFLKIYHVDIGDAVKAGQLLAEIEAPDLDQ